MAPATSVASGILPVTSGARGSDGALAPLSGKTSAASALSSREALRLRELLTEAESLSAENAKLMGRLREKSDIRLAAASRVQHLEAQNSLLLAAVTRALATTALAAAGYGPVGDPWAPAAEPAIALSAVFAASHGAADPFDMTAGPGLRPATSARLGAPATAASAASAARVAVTERLVLSNPCAAAAA